MKPQIILALTIGLFTACDTRVNTSPAPEKVVEKDMTIVNPAPKVEKNTTIINPPAEKPAPPK